MITRSERQRIIAQGRPQTLWEGEPRLGSVYGEDEIAAVVAAMRDSMEVSRGFSCTEPYIGELERQFAAYCGTKHCVLLNSAGPGLDMAMRFLNLNPGDEVIVPAINFVAAPLAVIGAGGQIVWAEVDPHTLQLDPNDVEKRISPKTRAIFPVHMNGLTSPMDELETLARQYPHDKHGPLAVVTDAARAAGGEYKGTKIGKRGIMTVFSFHTMKNMTTLGEGGAVTTDDDAIALYCRSTRFYGMETDDWGTSNVITKPQAAAGLVQLKKLDHFIAARRRLAHLRDAMLADVPEIITPVEPPDCIHTYYLYTCLTCEAWAGEKRDQIIAMMDEEYGVRCLIANPPAYEVRKYLRERTPGQNLPLSNRLGRRLFCVPIHPAMSDEDNTYIAASLIECIERLR